MFRTLILLMFALVLSIPTEAQFLKNLQKEAEKVVKSNTGVSGFSADEAAKAIKEALVNGTSKGTDLLSKEDGFYLNPVARIEFPPDARKVESALRKVGMGKQVDKTILSLNRAAEDASKSAKDIFVSAIQGMSISDAVNIVKGDTIAATKYLKGKTTQSLTNAFAPIIKSSLDRVDATKYWAEVMNFYNNIPLVEKVNPDLTQYITQKALEALFTMISREEALIRKDPIARTTELLKKVFGK